MMTKIEKVLKSLLIAAFIGGIFAWQWVVKINKVECKSQFGECNASVSDQLKVVIGSSLFRSMGLAKKLISHQALVRDFEISYQFPDTLKIFVVEKKPLFALKSKKSNLVALVGRGGEVIYFSENTNLPKLLIDSEIPSVGERVDNEVLFALEIVYLTSLYYDIRDSSIEGGSLSFLDKEGVRVVFPLEGDLYKLVGAYNLIHSRLRNILEESKIPKGAGSIEIDLRYKDPVIRSI